MDKIQLGTKEFLEAKLEWCKMQDNILELIEKILYKMRELVVHVLENESTSLELGILNNQLNSLKQEVNFLEQQLHSVVNLRNYLLE